MMEQKRITASKSGVEDPEIACCILAKLITAFALTSKDDVRISPVHISLYMALLHCWQEQRLVNPIYVFSNKLMPLAKISGPATYHRTIRELNMYGYIRYVPSYYHLLGSLVYMLGLEKTVI
jgi:hypothetical protein